ncbi:hypothetical protein CMI47_13005 [Candidatus Pacearchaeota archaeon]|nr:hypothetical protein [Candidatus Pacearchaeota archaeon]|tara:strand:+ start:30851 stop:31549 length:699 start_codon:yes stop_codon:yes gene_type:complete
MSDKTSLGNRMKQYENVSRQLLTRRMPMIIRVDGRAFHTLLKNAEKPWDKNVTIAIADTSLALCRNIVGAKLAYWQGDEISVLVTDYDQLNTQPWFNKSVQKIASVSASIATMAFNQSYKSHIATATFDARCFVLPKEEVCNYVIWRQQDAIRNSVQSLAQAFFSHKSLQNLNCDELILKLSIDKAIDWSQCLDWQKRGACTKKDNNGNWKVDWNVPHFIENREYINKYVNI